MAAARRDIRENKFDIRITKILLERSVSALSDICYVRYVWLRDSECGS